MKVNRKPYHKKPKPKTEDLSDLEVAKKMLKIYQSAVDRKLDFDLSFETVKNLLLEPTCYYTNKQFEEKVNDSKRQIYILPPGYAREAENLLIRNINKLATYDAENILL